MIFTEIKLKDAYIMDLEKKEDSRGFFARTFAKEELKAHGLCEDVVQGNTSYNFKKGTLRGMHFQTPPYEEDKIIRCTKGSIYDVIIDLRKKSKTYKKWFGIELSEKNYKMLYVPKGFAHGYQTLKDHSEVMYLMTRYYIAKAQGGVRYNDKAFNISWPLKVTKISDKDLQCPDFEE